MVTRSKAFEIEDGIQLNDGTHISSGSIVPIHTGVDGDVYFRSGTGNEETYRYESGSWVLKSFVGDLAIAHSATTGQTANDHHNELHTIASHSDTTATGAELNELTDGSETTLHSHAGGGAVVFGGEYEYAESDGNSTTNSSSFQVKLTTTFNFASASNTYRIGYYSETRHTDGGGICEWQLQVDGTEEARGGSPEASNTATDERHCNGGFVELTGLTGNLTVRIRFRDVDSDNTAHIRRARLEKWRVE